MQRFFLAHYISRSTRASRGAALIIKRHSVSSVRYLRAELAVQMTQSATVTIELSALREVQVIARE